MSRRCHIFSGCHSIIEIHLIQPAASYVARTESAAEERAGKSV